MEPNRRPQDPAVPPPTPLPQVPQTSAELNAISIDRIRRSQELMAELDRQLAASREAQARADEAEATRRSRNPIKIKRDYR
jgi:hypothetical protein